VHCVLNEPKLEQIYILNKGRFDQDVSYQQIAQTEDVATLDQEEVASFFLSECGMSVVLSVSLQKIIILESDFFQIFDIRQVPFFILQ